MCDGRHERAPALHSCAACRARAPRRPPRRPPRRLRSRETSAPRRRPRRRRPRRPGRPGHHPCRRPSPPRRHRRSPWRSAGQAASRPWAGATQCSGEAERGEAVRCNGGRGGGARWWGESAARSRRGRAEASGSSRRDRGGLAARSSGEIAMRGRHDLSLHAAEHLARRLGLGWGGGRRCLPLGRLEKLGEGVAPPRLLARLQGAERRRRSQARGHGGCCRRVREAGLSA